MAASISEENLSIAILCGGASRRFSGNKAFFELSPGQPLIKTLFDRFSDFGREITVISKEIYREELLGIGVPCEFEPEAEFAALYGLQSALNWAKEEWVGIVAVDMPLLCPEFFQFLVDHYEEGNRLILPYTDRLHPLAGIYHRTCLESMGSRIQNGMFRLQDFITEAGLQKVKPPQNLLAQLQNMNTLQDLEKIQTLGLLSSS